MTDPDIAKRLTNAQLLKRVDDPIVRKELARRLERPLPDLRFLGWREDQFSRSYGSQIEARLPDNRIARVGIGITDYDLKHNPYTQAKLDLITMTIEVALHSFFDLWKRETAPALPEASSNQQEPPGQ